MDYRRKIYKCRILLLAFVVLSCALKDPAYVPKFVIIFVDFSGSTRNSRVGYQSTLHRLLGEIKQGDRLIVAPITDKTLINFAPISDVTFDAAPPARWWLDNPLVHQQEVAKANIIDAGQLSRAGKEIDASFASDEESPKTSILASLDIAANLFAGDSGRRKQLIILSDMIEDSDEYDFDRLHLTPHQVQAIISQRRVDPGLPNLSSVTVYIAGAGGVSNRQFHEIETFWLAYLDACGAEAEPSHYAHSLMNYAG